MAPRGGEGGWIHYRALNMRNSKVAQALIASGASESGAASIAGHAYKQQQQQQGHKLHTQLQVPLKCSRQRATFNLQRATYRYQF